MASTKMYTSYKVDEGYSEDTRSQDDPDSPMRMEPGGDDMLQNQLVLDAVMALSEGEKTGKRFLRMSRFKANPTNIRRARIQRPTYPKSLVDSLRR